MDYSVFIEASAIEFIESVVDKDGTKLLFDLKQIGKNPHKEPDFSDSGEEGDLNGKLIDQYAVLYYVDDAVKRVLIVDVTYADKI